MKYEAKRWTKPTQTSNIYNDSLVIDLLEEPLDNSWKLKAKRLQARRWRKLRRNSV